MREALPSRDETLPAEVARRVDAVCTRFEIAWRDGERPRIDDFLGDSAEPERATLLAELILVDLHYRRLHGERCEADWYERQFPGLDSAWLADAVETQTSDCLLSPEARRQPDTLDSSSSDSERSLPRLLTARDSPPVSSRSFGDFELIREIARGGMGVVYLALQVSLKRHVALKMILAGAHADARQLARFQAEAEAVARLQHPHIVQIYEVGEHDGCPYLSLEHIAGGNLAQRIAGKPQPPRAAAQLAETLARAVHHAHQQGIIHRDLKPANVLLANPGAGLSARDVEPGTPVTDDLRCMVPKITDFGLAKCLDDEPGRTRSTEILGTPNYMAPELASGDSKRVGPATDVYALGGILYELLTGRPPFIAPTPLETAQLASIGDLVSPRTLQPNLPIDLETICLRCLEKDAGRRYASALSLAEDLWRYASDQPILARRMGVFERGWRWCRRNPAVATLTASVSALLVLSVIAAVSLDRERKIARANESRAVEAERKLLGQLGRTRDAERERGEELWRSRLDRARAGRFSHRSGQRYKSLDALREATQLRITPELRDEAIACLALVDVAPMRILSGNSSVPRGITSDLRLEHYVLSEPDGPLILRRIADDQEIRRLHAPGPCQIFGFSPDGLGLVANSRPRGASPSCLSWDLRGASLEPLAIGPAAEDVSFSPDGTRLAVVWPDSAAIFDWPGGRELERLSYPPGQPGDPVSRVAFHPDGVRLAVSRGAKITVFDPHRPGANATVWDTDSSVMSLAWREDGKLLAAGCDQHRIFVFAHETRELVSILDGHQNAVIRLTFSHAGHLLISTGWDETIRIWDPVGGDQLVREGGELSRLARTDDRLSALGSPNYAPFGLWKMADGRECRTLHHGTVGTRSSRRVGNVYTVDFQVNGRLMASAAADGIRLWDAECAVEVGHIPRPGSTCVRFHPSGDQMLTLGDRILERWPIRSTESAGGAVIVTVGPPVSVYRFDELDEAAEICWSQDGRSFAAADRQKARALVFSSLDPARRIELGPHPGVRYISLSPDGRWTATGTWQGRNIKVWENATGKMVWERPTGSSIVRFSPDGLRLVSSDKEGHHFWRTGSWQFEQDIHPVIVLAPFAFTHDGKVLACSKPDAGRVVKLIEIATGAEIAKLEAPQPRSASGLSFNSDGSLLAVSTMNQTIQLWDLRAIRRGLGEVGLDWNQPPYAPSAESGSPQKIGLKVINK